MSMTSLNVFKEDATAEFLERIMKNTLSSIEIFLLIMVASLFMPNPVVAGELDPPSTPAPTMKTLEEIYNKPIWKISDYVFVDHPSNPRFAVSAGEYPQPTSTVDDMVLDKETGLVWLRNADIADYLNHPALPAETTSTVDGPFNLPESSDYCHRLDISNRKGWRLPTVEELSSLIDMSGTDKLPTGHPFLNIQDTGQPYWSATAAIANATRYWFVFLDSGFVSHYGMLNKAFVLCVRGGNGRISVDF